MNIFLNIWH